MDLCELPCIFYIYIDIILDIKLIIIVQQKLNMTKPVQKQQPAKRPRSESIPDIPERTKLIAVLRQHVQKHIGGTQADKAKALGITQPRLNDLLKERTDKFSLDALVSLAKKAGLRVDVSVQDVLIHTGPVLRNLNLAPLRSTFAPAPDELCKLDSRQGPDLLLRLLRCEAIANGLGPKDVVLPSNINVPDGGIDAKVDNSPTSGSLLEKGSTYYQIKTGDEFKPWQPSALRKELFGKTNATPSKQRLGSEVKTCLEQNGTYVLITFGHDLSSSQHSEAVTHLTGLIKECGYTNPKIRVYGQGQIVGELDKYPSICLDLIGLDDGGFMSIESWRDNTQMQGVLELGDEQNILIKDIQAALQENAVQHIRIVGEPGIGKTRLVLKTLDIDEIRPSVVYVRTGEDFQKSKLFNELLKPDRTYSVTLVIDDCDNRDRAQIWSALKGRSSIKLITIDHGPDETHDSAMRIYHCPQLAEEQIKNILFSYLQQQTDLSNWAEWCGGSPRVAHLVGENLKSNPDDLLKSPADVPVWERFIIGHKEMASHEAEQFRTVLRHIALFQRFGFEPPVVDEAKFISGLVERVDPTITWGRFQQIVQHYRDKRILQGRYTLFIVPKMLHVHLWVQFWKNYGREFQFQSFLDQVPESMRRWFLQLFIYAQEAQEAQSVVKRILLLNGPFSKTDFLKSEVGMRFLNYLSEADPSSTLALLERTIKTWSPEKLHAWSTDRQDIVWALEKITVWDELFVRAVYVLIPMALAENSSHSNNSKGLLLSLFQVGLGWAPTQAPPSERFRILRELVMSDDASRRSLGLEMCEQWLSDSSDSRIVGAEYQGAKPPIEFWRPETYGEMFDYWSQGLQFLRTEMKGLELVERNEAVKILVNAAYGFVHIEAVANEIMDILFELAEDIDIDRNPLIQFVIQHLSQSDDALDKTILNRIRQLDKVLTGTSLWERTIRYILSSSDQEDYKFSRGKVKESGLPGKRVKNLAEEYTKDLDVFSEYIPKLVSASGYRLSDLGKECGKLAMTEFDKPIINYIETGSDICNGQFFGGYLAGVCTHNVVRYENLLCRLLNNEATRKIAINCMRYSGFTELIMQDMLALLKNRQLRAGDFEGFAFMKDTKGISDSLFQQVINTLLALADDASIKVCSEAVHSYYFGEATTGDFPEYLIFTILSKVPSNNRRDQMHGYYWEKIAKEFLKEHLHRKMELFNIILRDAGRISRYGNTRYVAELADDIVKDHPNESWKIISELLETEPKKRHQLISWMGDSGIGDTRKYGAIRNMPAEAIIDWVKADPDNRCWLIQGFLPKTLDKTYGQLTHLFIEEFCDDAEISDSLFVYFLSGGRRGPESECLSGIRDAARHWMADISSPKIRVWLGKFIDFLNDQIEAVQIREEREF